MKDVYRLLSKYNELKSTCYTAILNKDNSVSIKRSKDLKCMKLYTDIEDAKRGLTKAIKDFKYVAPKV